MASVSNLVILALLAASATAQQSRIVGGWPADQYKYRSTAQLDYYNVFSGIWNQNCAGTILNIRYIVTAAHCIEALAQYRRFRLGSAYRNTGGQIKLVDYFRTHPEFGPSGANNDISLARLSTAIEYNPVIGPAPIISQGTVIPDHTQLTIAGWGTQDSTSTISSPVLLETEVYKINHELCRERYANLEPQPAEVTENMFCAGIPNEGGRDACQGDSGGPVLYNDILMGIISWGFGCGHERYYGVNTAISSYTDWIVANTQA